MKQAIIAGLVAFAIFGAAGTGVGVMRAKKAVAAMQVADSLRADSASALAASDTARATETPHHVFGEDSTTLGADSVATAPDSTVTPPPAGWESVRQAVGRTVAAPEPAVATATATPPAQRTLSPMPQEMLRLAPVDSAVQAETGRLAKLFLAMSARDAAKVLEQMSDHDVVAILRSLPERRAGEILASIAPARSATLARTMLNRIPGGP